jgi:hypothetical protein
VSEVVGEAVVELRADLDKLRRDILKEGKQSGDRFGGYFSDKATKRLRGIGDSFKKTGVAVGTILTAASAVGPAVLAVGAAMSAAAAGATALIGAIGPAAAAGAAAYAGALLAVVSSALLVKFASGEMGKALGGDAAAMKSLPPAAQRFVTSLQSLKTEFSAVRSIAASRIFAGLGQETKLLGRAYFPLLNTAAAETGDAINKLAKQGARMVSTGPWRRDFATVAKDNATNIGLFGRAGLKVADAARSIFVAAQPLIRTFAKWTLSAATAFDTMIQGARASGSLAAFFHTAARNAALLGDIIGNVSVALFNIFSIGASGQGRSMLVNLRSMSAEFRAWTASDSGASKIAQWFDDGRASLSAMGRLLSSVTSGLSGMGSGRQLAPLIDQINREIIPPLMNFLHNASASGALSSLVSAVGQLLGVFSRLSAVDSSLRAFSTTLSALAHAANFILDNVPGATAALSAFFIVLGARQAASLVGLGGTLNALGGVIGDLTTKVRLMTGAQTLANGELATFTQNMAHASGVASAESVGFANTATRLGSLRAAARQAAGPAGLIALVGASTQSRGAMRSLTSAAGGAAAGFSVGGPWGAAIGGAVGLLASLVGANHRASASQRALRASAQQVAGTLDRETGAITRATRAAANQALADNGVYDAARKLNIPLHTVLQAYLGNGRAVNQVSRIIQHLTRGVMPGHIASTQKQREAQQKAAQAMRTMSPAINKVTGAIGSNNGALGKQRRRLQEQREAAAGSTSGSHKLAAGFHDAQDHASSMGAAAQRAAERIRKIPNRSSTHFDTPGLSAAERAARAYSAYLAHIDGRHVQTFFDRINTTSNKPHVTPNSAAGTTHHKGGWGWVGEEGPELMRLPNGSQVMPHRQSVDFVNKGGGGSDRPNVSFDVHVPTDDPEAITSKVMNRLVKAGAFG